MPLFGNDGPPPKTRAPPTAQALSPAQIAQDKLDDRNRALSHWFANNQPAFATQLKELSTTFARAEKAHKKGKSLEEPLRKIYKYYYALDRLVEKMAEVASEHEVAWKKQE